MISHGGASLLERKGGGSSGPQNPLYITATTYLYMNGDTLELWVNNALRQTWTTTPTGLSGQLMGALGITYP